MSCYFGHCDRFQTVSDDEKLFRTGIGRFCFAPRAFAAVLSSRDQSPNVSSLASKAQEVPKESLRGEQLG